MEQDWLFALPIVEDDGQTQLEILAEWLAADPAAAAIPDEEAETFVTVGLLLRYMDKTIAPLVWKACGVRVSYTGERAMRRATLAVLRRWQEPKVRRRLLFMIPNMAMGSYPDPAMRGAEWTEELFFQAYDEGMNLIWLVQVRRSLGLADNLLEWLNELDEGAEQHYRRWLDIGRLSLRRIVYAPAPTPVPPVVETEVAAAALVTLEQELRAKDQLSGALRHDVRRLERDRKQLKEQARRSQLRARALVSQARGDVAAARKALPGRLAQQERELADQARPFEKELSALRERLAVARADFVRSLEARKSLTGLHVLAGRTVTVNGSAAELEIYGLLVESLGGTLVRAAGELTAAAAAELASPNPGGFAAFERRLRTMGMERVLIKCDGLYRRKAGRPGIAMAGFQAHIGGVQGYGHSSVVNCGPTAGSLMAEYGAVTMALSWFLASDPKPGSKLEIWSDCRALLSRLRRTKNVRRKPGCVMLDSAVRRLRRQLEKRGCEVWLHWVPRDEVHAVDRLCAAAFYGAKWYQRPVGRTSAPLYAFLDSTLPNEIARWT